jgi:hypothetical protein
MANRVLGGPGSHQWVDTTACIGCEELGVSKPLGSLVVDRSDHYDAD